MGSKQPEQLQTQVETDIVERARCRVIEVCTCDICKLVMGLCEEIERLRNHVADLNHDLETAVKECNEHHG